MKTKLDNYGNYKQGVDENKQIKDFLHVVIEEAHELLTYERPDAYPYEFNSACDELEYKSRDGFIPNSYNHGGYSLKVFETVNQIQGSGTYPSSDEARKQIESACETNHKYALEELKVTEAQYDADDKIAEKVYDKADEMGHDDTIMFEITVMYLGCERGIHSACVQVNINWEYPYHRSTSAVSRCLGTQVSATEAFTEETVTWRTNRSGHLKLLKAIKKGIAKLF